MKTTLRELLDWIRTTLPMDLNTPRLIEEKIQSMLEKEKKQMIDFAEQYFVSLGHKSAEDYFNKVYNIEITVHEFIELTVECLEALLDRGHNHDYAVKTIQDAYYPYKPEMAKGNYDEVAEMLSLTFLNRKYQTPNIIPRYQNS
jgi:hypothetical protein